LETSYPFFKFDTGLVCHFKDMKYLLLILVLFSLPISAQSKKDIRQQKKTEAFEEVKAIIDSSVFEFTPRRAYPQGGSSIDLTTHTAYLKILEDSASARLPFFGKAYDVGYSVSGGGINFQGTMENYSVRENTKKMSLTVLFSVSSPNDKFDCTLEVSSISGARLAVNSQKRALISYSGTIQKVER
jgi:hypothetical protein